MWTKRKMWKRILNVRKKKNPNNDKCEKKRKMEKTGKRKEKYWEKEKCDDRNKYEKKCEKNLRRMGKMWKCEKNVGKWGEKQKWEKNYKCEKT